MSYEQRRRAESLAAQSEMDLSEYGRRCMLMGYVFSVKAELPEEVGVRSVSVERVEEMEGTKRNNGS